ncbi:3-hydroxyacyl-CoA dehydrogenase family protein [Kribbella sancticallisti]|uniref:3-hydroxyacyl-CoA dehydrogenase family protein n=1 Tax=Kribbella sancticallisti TaxID=460087 RepID=A0ABN2DSN6_9ACTN
MSVIAVLGLGTMGQGIAVSAAGAGHQVRLFDQPSRQADCVDAVRLRFDRHSTGQPADLRPAADLADAVRPADLVIEAVPESPELKRALFSELHGLVAPDAVIMTNTSSLLLDELVSAVEFPERFLAAHFFHPAELIPGVEIARTPATDQETVDVALAFLRTIAKEPVEVLPQAGFVANRLQIALFLEALACVAEGVATPAEIDTIVRTTFGLRLPAYGPFAIADMAGLDVYQSILATLHNQHGERFAPPAELTALLEAGRTGLKSGAGFHTYSAERSTTLAAERDDLYRRILAATA